MTNRGHGARFIELLRALNRDSPLPAVAHTILEHALKILPQAQSASFLVLNDAEGVFEYQAAVGYDLDRLAQVKIPKDRVLQGALGVEGPAIIRDPLSLYGKLFPTEIPRGLLMFPIAAFITFPIRGGGEVVAYLNVDSRDDPDAFSDRDLDQLAGLGEGLTFAVCAARERRRLVESEQLFRFLFERLADAVYVTSLDGAILEANPAAELQTGYSRHELRGMNIVRELAVAEPEISYAEINERVLRGDVVTFEEEKRRKDGTTFWTECRVALFEYRGQPATVSTNRDITDRKRLEEELAHRVAQLKAFTELSPTIAGTLDAAEVVQRIVSAARQLAGADHANVLLFDERGALSQVFDPLGAPPIPVKLRPKGFSRWILDTGRSLHIEDIRRDGGTEPVVRSDRGRLIRASPVLVREGVRSLVGIPIRVGKGHRAILYVHSRQPGHLTPFVPMLGLLAVQAGVALENALIYAEVQESESWHRALFDHSPLSLWIEDFSAVARRLDSLKGEGVADLRAHLEENPALVQELLAGVRVVDVNQATLNLYRTRDKEELLSRLPEVIPEEGLPLFTEELVAMWDGRTDFHGEGVNRTLDGRRFHIRIAWRALPGHEQTCDRVLISVLDVTDRVEAEQAAARRDRILEAVAFAAEHFLRGTPIAEAIPPVLARLGEAADVSRVYIFQDHRDDQGRLLTSQRYEWTAPDVEPQADNPELQNVPYAESGFSWWEEAFARGEVIVGQVREFPEAERAFLASQGIMSIVVAPITVGGRTWGFVGFDECYREREWSPAEIEALRTAAGTIGVAIEREALERDLRAVNADLQGLYEVSVVLARSLDLGELFQHIYEEVRRLIPCDAFTLSLVDERRREVRLAFGIEEGERLPEVVVPLDTEASLTGWIASTKKPLLIRDFEREREGLPARVQQVRKAVRSWLGVPLLFQDEVLGVLSVQSFTPHAYDERVLRLLRTLSAPVATAIRNARTHGGLAALGEKLRAVEEHSRRMKLVRDREELYALVLELTGSVLGYRPCSILEPRGDDLVVVAGHEEVTWAHGMRFSASGVGITVAAARSHRTEYVADVTCDERYIPANSDTRSELAIPIVHGERLFAVLDVQSSSVDGIPPDDRELLGILSSELAVAIAGLERLTALRAFNERLAGLHRLVMRLQRCSTVDEACAVVTEGMAEVGRFTTYNVNLVEGDQLVPKATLGVLGHPLPRGEGVAWKTLASGKTICGNLATLPEARPLRPDLQSVLSVPIGDFGVFQAASTERDAFTPEDVLVAEILAGHLREEIRRIHLEDELREQAIRDPLTGLYNRRFMSEVLNREVERATRYGHPMTLIIADIDDFKLVNDRYGHLAGDAALRAVAEVFRGNVRAGDFVFRYGGEEFVVVLPETGNGGGDALLRLREKTAAIPIEDVPGLTVRLSLGHVVWDPAQHGPTTVERLLQQADEVLYEMKKRRGGR